MNPIYNKHTQENTKDKKHLVSKSTTKQCGDQGLAPIGAGSPGLNGGGDATAGSP